MSNRRKILLALGWMLLCVILAALQISFLNPLFSGFNLVLLLILVLVIIKKDQAAFITAWTSGLLVGTSHFSKFGLLSVTFLIFTLILVVLYKKTFFTLKFESIIFIGAFIVILYHILEWFIINSMVFLNAGNYERLSFYILNRYVLFELITTTIFLLVIFYFKKYFVLFVSD